MSGTFLLSLDERRVIEAVLRFANLGRVDTAGSYARVFRCFAPVIDFRDSLPMGFDPGTGTESLTVDLRDTFRNAHVVVRTWLASVAAGGAPRRAVAREVADAFSDAAIASLAFDGRLLRQTFEVESVQNACALGVALILDESRGLANRLNLCPWSRCLRFNLDLDPDGRPRRCCNAEHARKFGNEDSQRRQQRYRAKQKRKSKG